MLLSENIDWKRGAGKAQREQPIYEFGDLLFNWEDKGYKQVGWSNLKISGNLK